MPRSNKSGVSYEGHVDVKPADKTQPEWVRVEDLPEEKPEPKNEAKAQAGVAKGSGKASGAKK